ncbi:hypothetical protein BKA70DRAFT_1264159 [Coprinopsis sp. MPI-PUGE-AT-0042]|nr:hypothetical protein BKA70DRAFT_1264159 [Coprinopsis sp. MPI-PUGE-AT-0042]
MVLRMVHGKCECRSSSRKKIRLAKIWSGTIALRVWIFPFSTTNSVDSSATLRLDSLLVLTVSIIAFLISSHW